MLLNTTKRWRAVNKHELILEVWEALDCESVGGYELEQIQQVLRQRFGEGGNESPAAIARLVADEGAVLRHPEVFECDQNWRLQRLNSQAFEQELNFSEFDKAVAAFNVLNMLQESDDVAASRLRDVVSTARQNVLAVSRSKIVGASERERAKEISHWLLVWLQSPQLFSDWLELRLRSDEFRTRFPDYGR